MTQLETLRSMFAREIGQEEYRRFLEAGVAGRLRYWQEQLISRFVLAHPELSLAAGELEHALRVCEVHGDELVEGNVPGLAADIDYVKPPESGSLFPKANISPIGLGSGAIERPVSVWFCPSCRRAYETWRQRANGSFQRTAVGGR
jgi:hypothetical protein